MSATWTVVAAVGLATIVAGVSLCVFYGLWFGLTLYRRARLTDDRPREIEERYGLKGGNIYAGTWDWNERLDVTTPIEGLYVCGASTYPTNAPERDA